MCRECGDDIYTPFNYNYTYNLKYMKICAGTN